MSEKTVKFKGTTAGVQLIIAPDAAVDDVLQEIEAQLDSEWGSRFFSRGTPVWLLPGVIDDEDSEKISRLFRRHGLFFRIEDGEAEVRKRREQSDVIEAALPQPPVQSQPAAAEADMIPMRVINRTVRSGENITSRGGVLIFGNVNAGAEIVAGGSIDVRGSCKGLVHAGAFGDSSAVIVADRLMPVQIRIADMILQFPDDAKLPSCPARAELKNDAIVIVPIERQEMN